MLQQLAQPRKGSLRAGDLTTLPMFHETAIRSRNLLSADPPTFPTILSRTTGPSHPEDPLFRFPPPSQSHHWLLQIEPSANHEFLFWYIYACVYQPSCVGSSPSRTWNKVQEKWPILVMCLPILSYSTQMRIAPPSGRIVIYDRAIWNQTVF